MGQIEREEFNTTMNRVFDKLDSHQESVNASILILTTEVAEVKTKVDAINIPDRPCTFLADHEKDHKESVDSWRKPAIASSIGALVVLIFKYIFK